MSGAKILQFQLQDSNTPEPRIAFLRKKRTWRERFEFAVDATMTFLVVALIFAGVIALVSWLGALRVWDWIDGYGPARTIVTP